jgi:hypothetical protein
VLPDPPQVTPTTISPDDLATILADFSFLEEDDEQADIASGDRFIDTSLSDDEAADHPIGSDTDMTEEESIKLKPNSFINKYLESLQTTVIEEIWLHGEPLCYRNGDFVIRTPHPFFALRNANATGYGPEVLYRRDVFVWFPDLLMPQTRLRCECGMRLSKNGM